MFGKCDAKHCLKYGKIKEDIKEIWKIKSVGKPKETPTIYEIFNLFV